MIFVSYSTVDQQLAEAVCASLESTGVRCSDGASRHLPGANWGASIVDALEACNVMALVFSDQVNNSPHISREVEYAMRRGARLRMIRVDSAMPASGFRLLSSEFAHAMNAERALEDRLKQLCETVSGLMNGDGVESPASPMRSGSNPATVLARRCRGFSKPARQSSCSSPSSSHPGGSRSDSARDG